LRATDLLRPEHGADRAAQLALALYTAYNIAATSISVPAGRHGDRRRPVEVLAGGTIAFAASYLVLAFTGPSMIVLAIGFVLGGIGIGCVETAQHAAVAALAPQQLRGSAFGLLATTQSLGNLVASSLAGVLWTLVSPTAAFIYAGGWMLIALAAFTTIARPPRT
jgi:MFS family permease